tara:strand:- start:592 stop:789 length:198 start_codon:yes stop_codon:yes gene_type:complete
MDLVGKYLQGYMTALSMQNGALVSQYLSLPPSTVPHFNVALQEVEKVSDENGRGALRRKENIPLV